MKKIILSILFMLTVAICVAQQKLNIPLQYYLKNHPKATIHLMVKMDKSAVKAIHSQPGVFIRPLAKSWYNIVLPAKMVKKIAQYKAVKKIYFSVSPGMPLSDDTMRINNHILGIYNGQSPLTRSYQGQHVLLGFVDTGIEIDHPDFMNPDSSTRIIKIWDQTQPYDGTNPYGYGQMWDSVQINNGTCTHHDQAAYYGHGSEVIGMAASDGFAPGHFYGVAPKADIAVVASDFSVPNWFATVEDGINFLYHIADSLNEPCVINISAGSYAGSHDGTDPASLAIDSIIKAKNGRVLVSAAGNAGDIPYHLHTILNNDTAFSWFKYNSSTVLGTGGMFFELWADTNDFKNVKFAFGMDKNNPNYSLRAITPFYQIQNRLNQNVYDTLLNGNGDTLCMVETYAEVLNGKYLLQVAVSQPDSSQYYLRFETTGNGKFDVWSGSFMGFSDIVNANLPTPAQFPFITHYKLPDFDQTIVSSFQCLPSVITVGTYNNRDGYLSYDSTMYYSGRVPGALAPESSHGPTRTGLIKPDITASGDIILSASIMATLAYARANQPHSLSLDGYHKKNGGTSMASPIVAGTAALLLEKCPNMSYQDVKSVLLNTAYPDSFTGSVPSNLWGQGKLNAFNAMISTNFNAALSPDSIVNICAGNQLYVSTTSPFSTYQWSNGDSGNAILASQSGDYYVTVTNGIGCEAMSDTLHLTVNPLPAKPPISFSQNKFYTTAYSGQLQWYFNGNPVGINDTALNYMGDGFYYVTRIDSNGCNSGSDTIQIVLGIQQNTLNNDFVIFPQPANHFIFVANKSNSSGIFLLRDIVGQNIMELKISSRSKTKVDLNKFANGIYFYTFKNNANQFYSGKLIIQK